MSALDAARDAADAAEARCRELESQLSAAPESQAAAATPIAGNDDFWASEVKRLQAELERARGDLRQRDSDSADLGAAMQRVRNPVFYVMSTLHVLIGGLQ